MAHNLYPKRISAILFGAALAALALFAAAIRMAESPTITVLPGLANIGPGSLGLIRGKLAGLEGDKPKDMMRIARQALATSPLAWEPFLAAETPGIADSSKSNMAYLQETVRRNPRTVPARVLLLRNSASAGDVKSALDHLEAIKRQNPALFDELMEKLAAMTNNEQLIDEVMVALSDHPDMYVSFVRGFSGTEKSPQLISHLIFQLPAAVLKQPGVSRAAIAMLVKIQAFDKARQIWAAGDATQMESLIHSPDFSDSSKSPPFNWELAESTTGVAERQKKGGLYVQYYGREPGLLARQLLVLSAARYVARMDYRIEGGADGAINLRMRCAESDRLLGKVALAGKAGVQQKMSLGFDIPDSQCSGQYLELIGAPQLLRNGQQIIVTRLLVEKGNGP